MAKKTKKASKNATKNTTKNKTKRVSKTIREPNDEFIKRINTTFMEAINKMIEFEKIYVKHVKDLMNILLTPLYPNDKLVAWFNNYILKSKRLARKKHYLQINKLKLIEVIKPLQPYIVGDITPLIESYKILEQLYDYIPKFEAATSAPGASRAKIKRFQTKIKVIQDQFKEQSPHITCDVQPILDKPKHMSRLAELVDNFHVMVLKIINYVHEIREENKINLVVRRRTGFWSKSNSPYSSPEEQ